MDSRKRVRKESGSNNNQYPPSKRRHQNSDISEELLSDLGVEVLSDDDDDDDSIYLDDDVQVATEYKEKRITKLMPVHDFVYKKCSDENSISRDDPFVILPDEVVVEILKRLNQKSLVFLSQTCRRFYRLYKDPSLWSRMDLTSQRLTVDTIGHILALGVKVLRLNSTVFPAPIFSLPCKFDLLFSRVKYLDLSYAWIETKDLSLLLSKMRHLIKLSLESLKVDVRAIEEIASNKDLDTLNLAMSSGLNLDSIKLLTSRLDNLESLNVGWTKLNSTAYSHLCRNLTSKIKHLDVSGGQLSLSNVDLVALLNRCPLIESLNISDCLSISVGTFREIVKCLPKLKLLEISRCYQIGHQSLPELKALESLEILSAFRVIPESYDISAELPGIKINKNYFGTIARPTVGIRRTSIWEQATRE